MAVDIYLDPKTNDIDLTNGTMRLTKDIEESSRQQCFIVLNTFKGEWFANINFGIPYLKNDNNSVQVLGKTRKGFLDSLIKAAILGRENITDIVKYESVLDRATNELTVSFEATTKSGAVISLNGITT